MNTVHYQTFGMIGDNLLKMSLSAECKDLTGLLTASLFRLHSRAKLQKPSLMIAFVCSIPTVSSWKITKLFTEYGLS